MRKRFKKCLSHVGTADGKVLHKSESTKAIEAQFYGDSTHEQEITVIRIENKINLMKWNEAQRTQNLMNEAIHDIEIIMGWQDLYDEVLYDLIDKLIANHKTITFMLRRYKETDLAALRAVSYMPADDIWAQLFQRNSFTLHQGYKERTLYLRERIEKSLRRGRLLNYDDFCL